MSNLLQHSSTGVYRLHNAFGREVLREAFALLPSQFETGNKSTRAVQILFLEKLQSRSTEGTNSINISLPHAFQFKNHLKPSIEGIPLQLHVSEAGGLVVKVLQSAARNPSDSKKSNLKHITFYKF
jgi:hypothetical protein